MSGKNAIITNVTC